MRRATSRNLFAVAFANALGVLAAALPAGALEAGATEPWQPADTFPLDAVERVVPTQGRMRCPPVTLVTYRGETLRYHSPVRVNPAFRDRLRRFEEVVRDVATQVYARAPKRIRHIGTFNCRRIARWPGLLSEHGLGNAIDVAGFEFGPLSRTAARQSPLPKALRRSFTVRMKDHWTAETGDAALHARFLRTLADRLIERRDIFRVLLGPAYPGHHDHFHFDCAPWRLVSVFVRGEGFWR